MFLVTNESSELKFRINKQRSVIYKENQLNLFCRCHIHDKISGNILGQQLAIIFGWVNTLGLTQSNLWTNMNRKK